MKASDVVSVNPARATEGSLHPETTARFLRARQLHRTVCREAGKAGCRVLRVANSVLGVRRLSGLKSSVLLLAARVMLGCFAVGLSASLPHHWITVGVAVASGLCALGLLARVSSATLALAFGYAVAVAFRQPDFPVAEAMVAAMGVWLACAGPGRISVDRLLRRLVFRSLSPQSVARRKAEVRLSYKAYSAAQD